MRRMLKIITALAIIRLAISGVQFSEASHLILKDSYWEGLTVVLGANNTFIVEVSSAHSGTISDIRATLMIYDFVGSTYSTQFSYTGTLFKDQSLYMRFEVSVPSEARASHYRADLILNYLADGIPQTQIVPLYLTIQGAPKVRCSLQGSVKPGWPATVHLSIENIGDGVARNVMVSITSMTPGVQVSSPVEAGMLNPAEKRDLLLDLFVGDNVDEAVTLTATVTWDAQVGVGGQYTTTQTLGVVEVGPKGLRISTNDYYLNPGSINEVTLLIENEGNDWAFRTSLSIQTPPGLSVLGSNTLEVGDLPPGGVTQVQLLLSTDPLESGPKQVFATLEWLDSGGEKRSSSSSLGFYVRVPYGPYLTAFSDTRVLKPGVQESVGIFIKNEGHEIARRVRVNLIPSKDLAILSMSNFELGDLEPGASAEVTTILYAPNISYGNLITTVELSYLDEHDSLKSQAIPLSFITEPPKQPLLLLIPVNSELTADETNELMVEVRNEGGPAKDLRIEIAFPSPELGSIVGKGREYVDSLNGGESVVRNFSVYLSPSVYGAVQLLARLSYRDDSGVEHVDVMTLGVRATGRPKIEVSHVTTAPIPVYPGDSNVKLIVLVTNIGNYLAKDLRLNLTSLPEYVKPSYAGSDTFLIPALPPGQTAEVRFLLNIGKEAKPGRYNLKLVSAFGETELPLQIDEKARFELVEFTVSGKPKPGDRGIRLSIVVRNEANVSCEDAVIEVITPYLTGTTSLAVGDVPGGTNSSAIMEVDIDKQAPLEIPVDVKISWKQEGRSLSQTIKTKIELQKEERADLLVTAAILTFSLMIVIIFLKKNTLSKIFSRSRTGQELS